MIIDYGIHCGESQTTALLLCSKIGIKNSGYIAVESELEIGTTFTFYLPALPDKEMIISDDQSMPVEEFQGSGNVLIMDDEEIVREVAGEIILHLGFEVDFAVDGQEAIEKYSQAMKNGKPFAMVIMT